MSATHSFIVATSPILAGRYSHMRNRENVDCAKFRLPLSAAWPISIAELSEKLGGLNRSVQHHLI